MAAFDGYASLKASLGGWVHRADVVGIAAGVGVDNAVDSWIDLFEAWANRKLRQLDMQKRASTPVATEYIAAPSDLLEAISLALGDGTTIWGLEPAPQWVIDRSIEGGAVGRPRFFAFVGGEFRMYPAPDKSYSLDLTYFAGLTPLSDAAPVNWLLTIAPDAYLYGSLTAGAPYLKDMNSLPVWKAFRDEAMAAVTESDRQPSARLRADYATPSGTGWNVFTDQ